MSANRSLWLATKRRERLATTLGLLVACAAYGQADLVPFDPPAGRVIVTERSDFSRYEDGRYVGHVYREARLDLSLTRDDRGLARYSGEALVLEETMRDERAVARRLDEAVPVEFTAGPDGSLRFSVDRGYPILRGVPASPPSAVAVGGRWTGYGSVVVRPRAGRDATRVTVLVEYEYRGPTSYAGRAAEAIRARYAVRYDGRDASGDPDMISASGGRTADIVIDAEDGSTLFIRETVDESYTYRGYPTVRLKGFILHFHRGSLPGDRDRVVAALAGLPSTSSPASAPASSPASSPSAPAMPATSASPATPATPASRPSGADAPAGFGQPGTAEPVPAAGGAFELARGERGVVMLLYDLRFVADGDELLASERGRLDSIAEALKRLPDSAFLVEGHTADLGKPAGQYELSERRARRIVDELVARGIPENRFVYRGLGADRPVAPNDTEVNRARNRRVEITILD
ncbi:MAG: OmpA family protein [Spirochaetaceae bacterium]|nr:OmpA family protein [Spirochaetaceae bacterium]